MREILDKITLGVLNSLEQYSGVTDVRMMDQKPTDSAMLDSWEQKYMCKLPIELKNFYQMTDGMLIQWNATFKGGVVQLGRMEINAISSLKKLTISYTVKNANEPSLFDIECDGDEYDDMGHIKPHFDERNRIYELDSCEGNGKVCLVYKDLKAGFTVSRPEIWFLDRSLQWWYLSDNFINYFRMMMIHLGLPNWQYLFTEHGLSPEAKFWFSLYAPERLSGQTRREPSLNSFEEDQNFVPGSKLNPQRLFNRKPDKKKSGSDQSKGKSQGTARKSKVWNVKQSRSRSLQR